jgi:hypothetical protein
VPGSGGGVRVDREKPEPTLDTRHATPLKRRGQPVAPIVGE